MKYKFRDVFKFGLSFRDALTVLIFSLCAPIFEVFGLALFIPIVEYLKSDGDVTSLIETGGYWEYLVNIFYFFGMDIELGPLLITVFFLICLRQMFLFGKQVFNAKLAQKLTHINQVRMFSGFLKADQRYSKGVDTGSLFNLFTVELKNAVSAVIVPLDISSNVVLLFLYIVVLFALSPEMTLGSIVMLSLTFILFRGYAAKGRMLGLAIVDANGKIGSFLQNKLNNVRMVKACGTQGNEISAFEEKAFEQRKRMERAAISIATMAGVVEPVVVAFSLSFLWFAYSFFGMQLELIGLYIVITIRLVPVVKTLLSKFQKYSLLLGSVGAVLSLQDSLLKVPEKLSRDSHRILSNGLHKHGLSVTGMVVRHLDSVCEVGPLNFSVKRGLVTCLIGESGVGKSSFLDAILGFVPIVSGGLYWDKSEVSSDNLPNFRQIIGYCPQNPVRLGETVGEHLSYGNDSVDWDVAYALAVELSLISSNTTLRDFLERSLGVAEDKVSGGQLQRLDLIRVLLSTDKQLLILDEPTSALDSEARDTLIDVIKRFTVGANLACLIVTHSVKVQSKCDDCILFTSENVRTWK